MLVFSISRGRKVIVGALGELRFEPGQWVYLGSAMGGGSTSIENRIRRHASASKKLYWHIDYLLPEVGRLSAVVWAAARNNMEHPVSLEMISSHEFLPGPKGFGCSDCRLGNNTHLFRSKEPDSAIPHLVRILLSLGLTAQVSLSPDTN